MITGHSKDTYALTEGEMKILPLIVNGFRQYSEDNAIKADMVVKRFNQYRESVIAKGGSIIKLSPSRLRKLVHFIRQKRMIPLISTENGYFVSTDKAIISKHVISLRQRASSITQVADAMEKFI